MILWSVDDSQSARIEPLRYGRAVTTGALPGIGWLRVVTVLPLSLGTARCVLLRLLRRYPGVELGWRNDLDPEQHPAVVKAAKLGAAADAVRAAVQRAGRRHLEVVRVVREYVALEIERQDPERVDHVDRVQVEPHQLVVGDLQQRELVGVVSGPGAAVPHLADL